MKLTGSTCYSRLLWLQCAGPLLEQAIYSIKLGSPAFNHEGTAGFIETKYEIDIKDLQIFTNIWESYYSLSDTRKSHLYGLAKGLGDCK